MSKSKKLNMFARMIENIDVRYFLKFNINVHVKRNPRIKMYL